MGRWRSGAPLVLAPEHDDPELGADPMRNNDFNYKEMDPHGYACPLGSHARRLNSRDTAHYMNRRRMIRRGATYTLDFTVPKRPIRKVHKGLPAFTTLTGGAYFFLPGMSAMRYLAALDTGG